LNICIYNYMHTLKISYNFLKQHKVKCFILIILFIIEKCFYIVNENIIENVIHEQETYIIYRILKIKMNFKYII
jgi:hypothetical protein